MTPAQQRDLDASRRSLLRAARAYVRWGRSAATAANRIKFDAAIRRLHKAAEIWARRLPRDQEPAR